MMEYYTHLSLALEFLKRVFQYIIGTKNLPAMQETLFRFLGQEDALENGKATLSSVLGLPW